MLVRDSREQIPLASVPIRSRASAPAQVSVDDTSSLIDWSGVNDWISHVNVPANWSLFDNTDTFSSVLGAWVLFPFNGSEVEYWGNQGPFHGNCLVTLDDGTSQLVSSNLGVNGVPKVLFSKSGLSQNTTHWINVTVVSTSFPKVCEIDRFVYTPFESDTTTAAPAPTLTPPPTPPPSNSPPKPSSHTIKFIEIGAGAGAALLAALAFLCYFIRKLRAQKRTQDRPNIKADDTTAQGVDPDSESLVNSPPSPQDSEPVSRWNSTRQSHGHMSAISAASDPVPRSQQSYTPSTPSSPEEKVEFSESYMLPTPFPFASTSYSTLPQSSPTRTQPHDRTTNQRPPVTLGTISTYPPITPQPPSSSLSPSAYPSLPHASRLPASVPLRSPLSAPPAQNPTLISSPTTTPRSVAFAPQPYQHQDAGRVVIADIVPQPEEIPPAYMDGWISER